MPRRWKNRTKAQGVNTKDELIRIHEGKYLILFCFVIRLFILFRLVLFYLNLFIYLLLQFAPFIC